MYSYQLALDPCEAAKQGNIAEVRYLLLKGADLNYNLYRSGRWTKEDMLIAQRRLPPLHSARKAGLLKITTLLIEKGADVNRGDGHVLMSPLSLACENGCYKVIKYLAEEGKAKTGKYNYSQAPWVTVVLCLCVIQSAIHSLHHLTG